MKWPSSSWSEGVRTRRLALLLQYEGTAYHGWQRQRCGSTIQATLEAAMCKLQPGFQEVVTAAGRTDTGVHAVGQVAHVDVTSPIPDHRWPKALNGCLPPDIRVLAARTVSSHWHACFSARWRRYRYLLYDNPVPNLFLRATSWHRYSTTLNERRMAAALQPLLGYHDLRAFQRAGSSRLHARTTVQAVDVHRWGDVVAVDVQCSGFLYGMMRLLVGQLVAVGEGRLPVCAFEQRWRLGKREEVQEAAPPQGLCFMGVGYEPVLFSAPAPWPWGQLGVG
ncbi:MAG: pseudouridine synthase [Candidatus Synechococcus spongiarum 15L]|uniref:tRNA pseudouridine synthase A n=1 Tax=Candidatus Synechococcus spongiarum 15L TaxID=1608419 RepID=A0A0G8AXU8_9SYNE|nr:MAG: pseudouridine synthase [Candidatus Synechococcus spongiarum 15L]MCY4360473.1 tRNA pseudouridine(38-40) synthase TruA [Cyanobacteria bacterium MAG APA_bin_95]